MLFSAIADLSKRKEAELVAVPFWEKPTPATPLKTLATVVKPPILAKDFTGREGEISLLYPKGGKEKRLVLIGLGKEGELSVEGLRRVYSTLVKFCLKKKLSKINLLLPNIVELRSVTLEECLQGICEGVLLTNYQWNRKTIAKEKSHFLKHVTLVGTLPQTLGMVRPIEEVAEAVYLTRDLINENADVVTPHYLGEVALGMSKKFPAIKTTIFDKKRIEREKMGLLLAVSQGAATEPRFIISRYEGNPRSKDHTLLVGKGVTFDSGGINLKPTGHIETMREDMSGAATVLGTLAAAAATNLKVNLTVVVPATENAVDAKSYKPGDIFTSYSGKTVEIVNTDAEGRLILADALSYAIKHLKPTRVIDLATLTGSMVVALGNGISGFFSNDVKLAKQLLDAGNSTSELLWQMPLHKPYKEGLKSDSADLKNCASGRAAGSITAALFLEEFVGKVAWAHIDIAGTAFIDKEFHYWPKSAVGFGVRLLVDFLKKLSR